MLSMAEAIEGASRAWLPPTCTAATAEERAAARTSLEALLAELNARLGAAPFLVGVYPG